MPTYTYMNNLDSITNKIDKQLKLLLMYSYNMVWTVLELEKRGINPQKIADLILKAYMYIYMKINKLYKGIKYNNFINTIYKLWS